MLNLLPRLLSLLPECRPRAKEVADLLLSRSEAPEPAASPGADNQEMAEKEQKAEESKGFEHDSQQKASAAGSGKRKRDAYSDLFLVRVSGQELEKAQQHLAEKQKKARTVLKLDVAGSGHSFLELKITFDKRVSYNCAEAWVKRDFASKSWKATMEPLPPSGGLFQPPTLKNLCGERGDSVLAQSQIQEDLRLFLAEELENFDFETFKQSGKSEGAEKIELFFTLSESSRGSLNGMPSCGQLPLPRHRAWFELIKERNAKLLALAQRNIRRALATDDSRNGTWFLKTDIMTWLLETVTVQIRQGSAEEPLHFDGGASIFHFSLTLSGRRTIKVHEKDGQARQRQGHLPIFLALYVCRCFGGEIDFTNGDRVSCNPRSTFGALRGLQPGSAAGHNLLDRFHCLQASAMPA
jgi:hypothetical protein